jgi:hypothetical protein
MEYCRPISMPPTLHSVVLCAYHFLDICIDISVYVDCIHCLYTTNNILNKADEDALHIGYNETDPYPSL